MAALVAVHTAGNLGAGVLPLLMGVLISDLGLTEVGAGLLLTVELSATFVGAVAVAPRMARDSRRRWAGIGLLAAVAGNAASAGLGPGLWLLVARAGAGLGAGWLIASASAAAAGSREPDRLFATIALLEGLAIGLLLVGLPSVTVPFGAAGAFLALATLCVCAAPLVGNLPEVADGSAAGPRGRAPHRAAAFAALAAILAMSVAGMGIWTLSERIGTAAGLGPSGVGSVLGAATVLGLGGAAAAAWLGTRRGRAGPLLLGVVVSTASMTGLALATTVSLFVLTQLVWAVAFFFTTPYLLGVAAALDPAGRWTSAASGMSAAGSALGPAAAGLLAANPGALATAIAAAGLLALPLLVPALRRTH